MTVWTMAIILFCAPFTIRVIATITDFGNNSFTNPFFVIRIIGIYIFNNAYNNSSMVLKVSDATKSILFLGDAGEENGEKLLQN